MNKDVEGIVRYVLGFEKEANEDGVQYLAVEYEIKNISLASLQKIFGVDPNDPDAGVRDIIDPLEINEEQSKQLQPYVNDGKIDIGKYDFQLECFQAPGSDWSKK